MTRWKSAALGIAGLAACAVPVAAQEKGQITVMAYGDAVFKDNYTETVLQPFEKATGIRVQYFASGNSAQMLGALRAQKADPQTDIVIMDTTTAALACAEGLVDKASSAQMPVLEQIDGLAREAGGECGPGVTYDNLVMIYNTENVKPAPTGFVDMADPARRGRVGLGAPPNIQGLALTAVLAHADGGDWTAIAKAMPVLKRIAANTQTFDPKPDSVTFVVSGQGDMTTNWNARSQLMAIQSKGKIGVTLPSEGTAFQINTINVVANSRNAAAARSFMAYALGAEAQKAFTERVFYGPTNTTAQIAPEALNRTAMAPQFRERVVNVNWAEMQKLRDSWNQRWRREVITAAP
ncbi:extracellular solute-binding protein [Pseudoroseomonas globiformis]|uniref:Extracellular solute-binding protein n=1 Tax=Teichococcus globiformis TaxID=2307229 RepID=A0ABV7G859_9PROT